MKLESSSLSIYEVEELKAAFVDLLKEDNVLLDLQNVSKVDMCALQLLISLKRSAQDQGKELEIIHVHEEVSDACNLAGISHILGV
jgi:anti-anti-sigma factor